MNYTTYNNLANSYAERYNITIDNYDDEHPIIEDRLFKNKMLHSRISFTPYIYNQCSAVCQFCSERIHRKDETPFSLNSVCTDYYSKLDEILHELSDIDIFLSISGMEPLESLDVLESVLTSFHKHQKSGGSVSEKVIYSNLSAMVHSDKRILELIKKFRVDRVETSRHHYDEDKNQEIMRFRKDQLIALNTEYTKAVSKLVNHVDLKLACVLQKQGVNSVSEVGKYLDWANSLGVSNITFREFSILTDHGFTQSKTTKYIGDNRIDILSILSDLPDSFELKKINKGYYYFSFMYRYKNILDVIFEVSDYEEMIKKHSSDTINKLIYYPNSDLCMDWNKQRKIN